MREFMTEEITLSMRNPETGRALTANVYTVEGVNAPDGSPKLLSIGQLVMAICLCRAVEMEDLMVGMMAEMEVTTDNLSALTKAETLLQDGKGVGDTLSDEDALDYYVFDETTGTSTKTTYHTIGEFLTAIGVTWKASDGSALPAAQIITGIETRMDGLNTFSQQKMIELQSYTNKRDQTYDLISNMLKAFNTVLHANANNL